MGRWNKFNDVKYLVIPRYSLRGSNASVIGRVNDLAEEQFRERVCPSCKEIFLE